MRYQPGIRLASLWAFLVIVSLQLSSGPLAYGKEFQPMEAGIQAPAVSAEEVRPEQARQEQVRIVINIPSRTLWVYAGNEIVKYFPVGVGRVGFSTPVGKYQVIRKVTHPTWENPYKPTGQVRIRPGANNPLGTRWIGFHPYQGGEYGIHGTDNPGSVGKFSSHGCVRMKIPDAEALFDLVELGTPVEVTYDVALIRRHGDNIRLVTYADVFHKGKPTVKQIRERILAEYPGSRVDETAIAAALGHPKEQFVVVGQVASDAVLAQAQAETRQAPLKEVPVETDPLILEWREHLKNLSRTQAAETLVKESAVPESFR